MFNAKCKAKNDDQAGLNDSGIGEYQNPSDILPIHVKTEIME